MIVIVSIHIFSYFAMQVMQHLYLFLVPFCTFCTRKFCLAPINHQHIIFDVFAFILYSQTFSRMSELNYDLTRRNKVKAKNRRYSSCFGEYSNYLQAIKLLHFSNPTFHFHLIKIEMNFDRINWLFI